MSFNRTLGLVLLLATTVAGTDAAYAGFGASYLGQKTEAQQSEEALKGLSAAHHSAPPSLQIYEDRYVPDAVRKKYRLGNDWYDKGAAFEKIQPVQEKAQIGNTPKPQEKLAPADSLMVKPAPLTAGDKKEVEVAPEPLSTPAVFSPSAPLFSPAPAVEKKAGVAAEVKVDSGLSAKISAAPVESWRARKGENLRDILKRWSERNHANLMWASSEIPVLQKDFSFFGKYQDAVNSLIKAAGGQNIHSQYRSEGFAPAPFTPAATVTSNSPAIAVEPEVVQLEEKKPEEKTNILMEAFKPAPKKEERRDETRWFGLSGAPLAEVIRVWSEDAGVKLIWMSEKNFALKDSVSQVGQYEDVVYQALSQYDNEDIRPVGEIYHDPRTGERVLLVRTEIK